MTCIAKYIRPSVMEKHHTARVIFTGAEHEPKWFFDKSDKIPLVEDGEVLARIRLATICGSDLHTITGKRPADTPLVLGHEAVGEIVCDKRVKSLPPGTRITFSIISSCGKCQRCRFDLPQKCATRQKVGHSSLQVNRGYYGCYATHIILGNGTHIIPIPDNLTDRMVTPVNCALATMVNAVEHARTGVQDKSALLLGAGLLGIYGCALLKENGYEKIYCTDLDSNRLNFAEKFGAETIHPNRFSDEDFLVNSVDTVIEVCGNPDVIQDGYRKLRHGGTLVLVGLVHPYSLLTLTGEQVISKCITIKGVHNYAPRHLDAAMEFLSKTVNQYPYEDLVSPHPFSLEHLERALNEADKRLFHRSCIKP